MHRNDPEHSLAVSQFDGTDLRLLEQLIVNLEAEKAIKKSALVSFGIHANSFEQLEVVRGGGDRLGIKPENQAYIAELILEMQDLEKN
jgi:hypothetical protein